MTWHGSGLHAASDYGASRLASPSSLVTETEKDLPKRVSWLRGLPGGKITDRGLGAPSNGRDLRLSQAMSCLNVGNNVFPLHAPEYNGYSLPTQRLAVIGFPYIPAYVY
jgi:hypothetical protein